MIDWKGLLEALFPVGCNFDFTWFAVDLPSTVNQVNYTLENATTQLQNFLASVKDDIKQIDFSKYTTTAKGAFTLLPVILNDSSFGDFTIANFGAFLDLMYYVDTLCSTPSDLEDLVASDLHHPKINISIAYCTARSAGTLATFTGSCIEVIPDNEAASTRLLGGGVHYKTERRVVNRRYIRWIQKAASSSARTEGLQNVLGSSSGANPTAMTSEMRKAIAFTKRAKFLNENVHRIPECEHFGVDLLAELMKCQEAKSLVNGAYIKMGGVFHVIPLELMVPSHDYAAQTQQRRTLMHATSIQTANLGGFELPVERPRKHPSIDFSDLPAMLTRWARGHQCLELAEWEPLYEYVSFFRVWSERFASMPHLHKYLVDLDGGFFRQGLHSDTLAGTPFGTSLISMNEKVKKEGDERAKHIMLLYRDSQPIPNELQFRSSGQGKGPAASASSALGLHVIHRTVRVARRAASRILGTKAAILRTGVRRVRQKELICPRLRNLLLSSVEHATTIISSARHARRILAIFRTSALTPVADRSIPCVSTTLTGSGRIWLRRVSLFD